VESTTISSGTAGLLCLISLLVLVGLIIYMSTRGRSAPKSAGGGGGPVTRQDPSDPWVGIPTAQMEADANSALVAADDALKTSEQELTFATAAYGSEATAGFRTALESTRTDVVEAFRLRQLLDDQMPDDELTARGWLRQIIDRCRAADARLDAQVDSFDRLRDIQARLEPLVGQLSKRRDSAVVWLPHIDALYSKLSGTYATSALLPISNNAAQFGERVTFADRSLTSAREAMAADKRPEAALAVRAAEEALGQVDLLLDGVEKHSVHLEQTSASVQAELDEIDADIAAGKAALAAAGTPAGGASAGTVDLAAAVAGAEQTVEAVRADMGAGVAGSKPDPFAALRRLERVDQRLSRALASIRDAATRVDRARAVLDSALPAARAEVSAAESFITTRRGAVGAQARTRLAEAQRHLDQANAMAETDPVAALSAAQQAESMAAEASQLANEDVEGWSEPEIGGAMGGFGGAVLGGILIDSILSGGRGRYGPGYGGGLGIGGFSGGGFGWGPMMPGSFGGGGRRVRVRF
jgi:cell division septum initiation protein DivIVA